MPTDPKDFANCSQFGQYLCVKFPKKKVSFRFHLQGPTIVLIDWANVFNWFRGGKFELDPQRLFDALKKYPNIEKIYIFVGEDEHEKSKEFLKKVQEIGFEVVTKKVKYMRLFIEKSPFWNEIKKYVPEQVLKKLSDDPILKPKCDFDVEIATRLLLDIDHFHTFVLFSGDGDYAPVIEEIMLRQKRVFVVAQPRALGREFRAMMEKKVHPLLVDIADLGLLSRRKFPPRKKSKITEEKTGVLTKILSGIFGKKKKGGK